MAVRMKALTATGHCAGPRQSSSGPDHRQSARPVPARLAASATGSTLAVRLLCRPPGARKGGLNGAVVADARQARGAPVLVMDADLQNPPETAAALAQVTMRNNVDIVAGMRYASSASSSGLASSGRGIVSAWSTRLAKSLSPHRLAGVSDPMSGLSRSGGTSVSLDRLKPVIFKILFEILVRHSQGTGRGGCVLAPRHGTRADPRHPVTGT